MSCSTSKKSNDPLIDIEILLNQGRFSEAKEFAKKNIPIHKVENAESCLPIMLKCEKVKDILNEVRGCQYEISKQCYGLNNISYNYTKGIANRLDKLLKELDQKIEIMGSRKNSFEEEKCRPFLRWGYIKEKMCSTCARSIKKDLTKLEGNYLTRDKCEEARILEDKSIDTGDSCLSRNQPNNISIESYTLLAINNFKKLELEFEALDDCNVARNLGYKHYNDQIELFEISGFNSDKANKIIGTCEKKTKKICN
jgi:hypothetical protein